VLEAEAARNETYLVADKEPICVADLVAAMRAGLGRSPHLVKMPLGGVKRLLKTVGREADWERIAGDFVVDASKLMDIGWRPEVETRAGITSMMRAANGSAL
jgi:UDP-glucose 4-epimerase